MPRRTPAVSATLVAALVTTLALTTLVAPASHGAPTSVSTFPVGKSPEGLTISPDGRTVYVANADSDSVSVIDAATGSTTRSLDVAGFPIAVDVSPDSRTLYVASVFENSIEALDPQTGRTITRTDLNDSPNDLVVSPDGKRVYTVSGNDQKVFAIDTATGRVVASVGVKGFSESLTINPTGTRVYALVTSRPSAVRVIDTATNAVVTSWPLGDWATDIVISADGARAYITTFRQRNSSGTLRVIDTATGRQLGAAPAGLRPTSMTMSPDGRTLYVASQGAGFATGAGSSGLVSAHDSASGRLLGSWAAEGAGTARKEIIDIAVTPSGSRVFGTLAQARVGISLPTSPVPATPGLATGVSARITGSQMAVRWQAPAGSTGALTYVASAVPLAEGPMPTRSCRVTRTSCTITGLSSGLRYEVHVQAQNAAGWGPTAAGRPVRTKGSAGPDSVQ